MSGNIPEGLPRRFPRPDHVKLPTFKKRFKNGRWVSSSRDSDWSTDSDSEPQKKFKAASGVATDAASHSGTTCEAGQESKTRGATKHNVAANFDDLESTQSEHWSTEGEAEVAERRSSKARTAEARLAIDRSTSRITPTAGAAGVGSDGHPRRLNNRLGRTKGDLHTSEGKQLAEVQLPSEMSPSSQSQSSPLSLAERHDFTALPTKLQTILERAVTLAAATMECDDVDGFELAWRHSMWATGCALVEAICKVYDDDNVDFTMQSRNLEITRGWMLVGLHQGRADALQKRCDELSLEVKQGLEREARLTEQLTCATERAKKARALLSGSADCDIELKSIAACPRGA
ncbi:hypothetical protein V8E36_005334 [Tilletia maclaganii]